GVKQRRPSCGGIRVDQLLHECRESRFVHTDIVRARGAPAVLRLLRRTVDVTRLGRRAWKESGHLFRRAPGQFDRLSYVAPFDLETLGRNEEYCVNGYVVTARAGADAEVDGIALAFNAEQGGAAVRIDFRIAERADKLALRVAVDLQIEREGILERAHCP